MAMPWLDVLKQLVEKKPIVVLRFDESEWECLRDSRRSVNEFTIARPHAFLKGVKAPTPCLIQGNSDDDEHLYFGLISSRSPVTTLESRIKVRRSVQIQPNSTTELFRLVTQEPHAKNLKSRLQGRASVVTLSPKLSSHLIERLASIDNNRGAMRAVAESLSTPKRFQGTAALQEDAVRAALMAFGLTPNDQALSLELVAGRETALARVSIMEDSVIEHDARHIPGYDLVRSDLTGHAVFERGEDRLEVFTANRRSLEHCFGVDLIYLNASRQNIVMLQYKMLEPSREETQETDWIYRPDAKLDAQIQRMQAFAVDHPPRAHEYRLNPTVFYLKFVKRDGSISNGGIITPLDHFEKYRRDPACQGPKKGLRVSYRSLSGRYLRQSAFLDLIRAGYIGAHAETTEHMKVLVDAVLQGGRSVVAAIQQPRTAD
ncbi:MAG: hypothetical protein ACRDFW_04625 [bacterium]